MLRFRTIFHKKYNVQLSDYKLIFLLKYNVVHFNIPKKLNLGSTLSFNETAYIILVEVNLVQLTGICWYWAVDDSDLLKLLTLSEFQAS